MIDLHVDCVLQRRLLGYDITRSHRALLPGQPFIWHSDLPRMIEAGYQGVCLGVHYFPWQSEAAWRELNVQLDYIDEVVAADPRCLRVRESADWQRARDAGKLAVSAGIEGAHMLNGELSRVEALAARGISYMTLAHFGVNDAVTPSWGRGSNERDGLTGWGRELVAELERHRVWIDVAHVNTPGVLDVCAIAKRPVLCTHTGARAMRNVDRNLADESVAAIRDTGGLIGVICAPMFMGKNLFATSACVLNGIEWMIERVGLDHVAIGSDLDGWLWTIPRDMRDCRDMVKIPQGLAARGMSQGAIDQIMWGNALRYLGGEVG